MADVRRFDPGQKRDPNGEWGDGIPGPGLSGMDWDKITELYGDQYDEAIAGDFTVSVFENGDFTLIYKNEHDRYEPIRELDPDEAEEIAGHLDDFADQADDYELDDGEEGTEDAFDYQLVGPDHDTLIGHTTDGTVMLSVGKSGEYVNGMDEVGSENADQFWLLPDEARDLAQALRDMVERYDELQAEGDDASRSRRSAADARAATRAGESHVFGDGYCLTCADDEPDGPMDDGCQLLLAAISELAHSRRSAFNPADHPRNPKGSGGGGRFRSNVDKLKDAIAAHRAGGGKGDDPFEGFDREQLRRVAKSRGIELKRGEGRDAIAKKLLQHLGGDDAGTDAPVKPAAPAKPKRAAAAVKKKVPSPKPKAAAAKFDEKNAATGMDALDAAPRRSRVVTEAHRDPAKRREFLTKLESIDEESAYKLGGTGPKANIAADARISDAERSGMTSAVDDYMRTGYFSVNGALHDTDGKELGPDVPADVRARIERLDQLLDLSVIDRDSVYYRGTRFEGEPPDELYNPAFSSTSADRRTAHDFAHGSFMGVDTGSTSRPGTPTVMEIWAPKGTHGVQLSPMSVAGEVLLPRGLRLKKVRDKGMIGGARYVTYQVVVDD